MYALSFSFCTMPPTHTCTQRFFYSWPSHQSTVDRDSLAGSVSSGSSAFQPLRAGQIHKVELGHQCLELRLGDGAGVHTVHFPVLSSSSSILSAGGGQKQLRMSVLLGICNYFIALCNTLIFFYYCFPYYFSFLALCKIYKLLFSVSFLIFFLTIPSILHSIFIYPFLPSAFTLPSLYSKPQSHHLKLLANSHLTQVDGENGVRAGALGVHLGAGCCAGQSAELQTLQQLRDTHAHTHTQYREEIWLWSKTIITVDTTWWLACSMKIILDQFIKEGPSLVVWSKSKSHQSFSDFFQFPTSLCTQNAAIRKTFFLVFSPPTWLLSSFQLPSPPRFSFPHPVLTFSFIPPTGESICLYWSLSCRIFKEFNSPKVLHSPLCFHFTIRAHLSFCPVTHLERVRIIPNKSDFTVVLPPK